MSSAMENVRNLADKRRKRRNRSLCESQIECCPSKVQPPALIPVNISTGFGAIGSKIASKNSSDSLVSKESKLVVIKSGMAPWRRYKTLESGDSEYRSVGEPPQTLSTQRFRMKLRYLTVKSQRKPDDILEISGQGRDTKLRIELT